MKVKIGDLTQIKTGKLDANASSEDGQYPFFTCSREPLKISTYSYDCECVLVAGNGDLNVKYYNGKFDAYQRTYIIEDNGSGKLYMPYLYYFMEGYIEELRKQSIGGVIKYIKLGHLTDAMIELPSVDEQRSIVLVLEKAKGILNKRNDEISTLDDLIKARFVEMFANWKEKYLAEPLGKYLQDITYGFTSPMPDAKEGPWKVTAKDVVNGIVNLDTARKTLQESYDKLTEKSKPQVGDVLLTKDGTLGRTAVVEIEGICVNQSVAVLRTNEKILPKYLSVLLQMPKYQRDMIADAGGGTIKHIYITKVVNMPIVVPSIEEQNTFLGFINQVDKSKVAAM